MHLEGPWLSTTGKRKGKQKFASADAKRKSEQLEKEWNELQSRWGSFSSKKSSTVVQPLKVAKPLYRGIDNPRIPSLNNGVDMAPAVMPPTKVYTGTKMIGIGTMHKSNSVPIFSSEEATDIAKMRR